MQDKTFRHYELPADRSADSFTFKVEELDYTNVTDALFTDDAAEVQRVVGAMLQQGYDARVTCDGHAAEYRHQG